MAQEQEPFGLAFEKAVAAGELEDGQIMVIDGHVIEVTADPDDPDRVRVVIVRALAGVRGDEDDREVVLTVPRDMKISTAVPHNMELPAPPPRS